jgi:hypothetical protein
MIISLVCYLCIVAEMGIKSLTFWGRRNNFRCLCSDLFSSGLHCHEMENILLRDLIWILFYPCNNENFMMHYLILTIFLLISVFHNTTYGVWFVSPSQPYSDTLSPVFTLLFHTHTQKGERDSLYYFRMQQLYNWSHNLKHIFPLFLYNLSKPQADNSAPDFTRKLNCFWSSKFKNDSYIMFWDI